jgi:hypothetical protein
MMQMSARNALGVRYVFDGRSHDRLSQRSSGLRMLLGPSSPSNIRRSIAPSVVGTPAPHAAAPYRASGFVHWPLTDVSVSRMSALRPTTEVGSTNAKGGGPAPLIEISLIEWMSGILSKVRISRTIKHLRDRRIAESANHGNIALISCERGSFVTAICAPRKRAPDPRDRSGSCGSKR